MVPLAWLPVDWGVWGEAYPVLISSSISLRIITIRDYKDQSRNYRANDPVRYLLNQARYRAKKKGEEFSVVIEDLEIPTHCPVFGIPLFFTPGGRTKNSFSLDRVDNSKGYVKGNVRVISFWANQMKGDMTVDQVESLYRYMKGIIY